MYVCMYVYAKCLKVTSHITSQQIFLFRTYSKEFRISFKHSVTTKEVAADIRQLTGMKGDKPFNVKWLDVEGAVIFEW